LPVQLDLAKFMWHTEAFGSQKPSAVSKLENTCPGNNIEIHVSRTVIHLKGN